MHLIGFLLHAPKHERKSALKMPDVLSLKTRKAMFLQVSGNTLQQVEKFQVP